MARRKVELLSREPLVAVYECRCDGNPSGGACAYPDCALPPPTTEELLGEPESVLSEAARLVDGDRQAAYGHPAKNHGCTAELWTAYLRRRCSATKTIEIGEPVVNIIELDAFDVCMLNILQKVSRLAHSRQRDGLVDLAGFARNAEMVDE